MRLSKSGSLARRFILLFGLVSAFPAAAAAEEKSATGVWRNDIALAEKEARRTHRPLLIHFYADWCGPCRKMERETFGTVEFARQIRGKFVAVKVNVDKQPDVAKRFAVKSLPTDLVITSSGQVLARSLGYQKTSAYIASLARWESKFAENAKVQIAKRKSPTEKSSSKPTVTEKPAGKSPKTLIGMDGYSPVALHQSRTWVEGKREFAVSYQGVKYWMATADEQAEFQRDPRKFAPRLLGCDPVILQETDRAIPGKIDFGAFFDGELFFFATDENRKRFQERPLDYTRTRHVLRIEEIGGTVRR